MASESDASLMERVRNEDAVAFRMLLERHWATLVRYASGIIGLRDSAEDVVQETFIRVWRHRAAWVPSGSVAAYLHRITRNVALNAKRKDDAEMGRRVSFGVQLELSHAREGPDAASESLEEEINNAIASLPPRRREIFMLARFQGLTHREIADLMEISPQTVANQMASALTTLRELLSAHLEER